MENFLKDLKRHETEIINHKKKKNDIINKLGK